jgi:hypothetical protein
LSALADIDANQGDYPAARARYEESLRIERELDDRRGEAATIAQLGWLARQWRKRDDEAFRLYMVAWLLLAPMGHTQAGTVGNILNQMAADLGYDKDTVERVVQDVEREYASDGGRGMIDEALRDEA